MPRQGSIPTKKQAVSPLRVQSNFRESSFASARNLAASGRQISRPGTTPKKKRIQRHGWQVDVWKYYDCVGEFRFAISWPGNIISKARLYIAKAGVEVKDDPKIQAALDGLYGGPDNHPEMLRRFGVCLTAVGEAYLVGVNKGEDAVEEDSWEVVTANQINTSGPDKYKVLDEIVENPLVVRVWRGHPNRLEEADAPTRAVLPSVVELDLLTKRVQAQTVSRLTSNGMLAIPNELTLVKRPVVLEDGTVDVVADENGAVAMLQELYDTAVEITDNPSSPEAALPMLFQGAAEYLDKIKHITFSSDFDEKTSELRKEAIGRIGLGMDMPPEVLTGVADLNHWGSWQVEEAGIKAHAEPLLEMICQALTKGYLRYFLEGDVPDDDLALYTMEADTAELRLRPNRSKEALELFELGILSIEALLRETGFDETDHADEKAFQLFLLRKIASGSTTPEIVEAAIRKLGVELDVRMATADADGSIKPDLGEKPEETQEARPAPSLREHPVRELPTNIAASAAPAVSPEACSVLVLNALQRAGNRIKGSMGSQRPDCKAVDAYLRVPRRTVDQAEALLSDAWDHLSAIAPAGQVDLLAQDLTRFTVHTIVEQRPFDSGELAIFLAQQETNRLEESLV